MAQLSAAPVATLTNERPFFKALLELKISAYRLAELCLHLLHNCCAELSYRWPSGLIWQKVHKNWNDVVHLESQLFLLGLAIAIYAIQQQFWYPGISFVHWIKGINLASAKIFEHITNTNLFMNDNDLLIYPLNNLFSGFTLISMNSLQIEYQRDFFSKCRLPSYKPYWAQYSSRSTLAPTQYRTTTSISKLAPIDCITKSSSVGINTGNL